MRIIFLMHLRKHTLQFKGFRGRIDRFETLSSVYISDSTQYAALFSPLVRNRLHQVRNRRFAVCPGHAEYQHLIRRTAEEIGGNGR